MPTAKQILEDHETLRQALEANPTMPSTIMTLIEQQQAERKKKLVEEWSSLTPDNINAEKNGTTPLMLASLYGYTDAVRQLIAKGANVNVQTGDGTALHLAAHVGRTESVKILIENGANSNLGSTHRSPLQVAAGHCYSEMVQLLLDAGADPYTKDAEGRDIFAIANTFPLTDRAADKSKTIEILNNKVFEDYRAALSKRPKNDRYDSLKHTYGFFCFKMRPFGFSVQEKTDASEALKNVLSDKQPPSTLAPHLEALQNGKLGIIFARYVTLFPDKLALDNILHPAVTP